MNALRSNLDAEIQREGAISFARFMEIALYTPGSGYYSRPETVGCAGDFYTSVSVGSLFGELLATKFAQWLGAMSSPRLQLVEAAAHHGHLALDILEWFSRHEPSLVSRIEYTILEPSMDLRGRQQESLASVITAVRWAKSWDELPNATGIIFSNELLDAFPVQVISWDKYTRSWRELGVTLKEGRYTWTTLPEQSLNNESLPTLPSELLDLLPHGFRTELNTRAVEWWRQAANALRSGYLMTIDYGLETEDFFSPERASGTLRSYKNHRLGYDLLANPGEQDLTAHVDFAKLRRTGEECGLFTTEELSQSRFLSRIMAQSEALLNPADPWTAKRLRQFQTLIHPEHLGRNFRVLVQHRQG